MTPSDGQVACPECGTVFSAPGSAEISLRCPDPACRAEFPLIEGVDYGPDRGAGLLWAEFEVLSGDAPGRHDLRGEGPWTVGRGADCDVTLNDGSIAEQHLVVRRTEEGVILWAEGQGASEKVVSGRELSVGSVRARLWLKYSPEGRSPGAPPPLFILPEPIDLQPLDSSEAVLVVGRNRNEVDVSLPVRRVSRRHALLRREKGTVYVYDLKSRHGVFLNGERVTRARLQVNDVVSFGPCPYRYDGRRLWLTTATGMRCRVENVTYEPPGATAAILQEVSLSTKANEFVGIVGPSGSGKTTLLKVISSYLPPTDGTVRVDGEALDAESIRSFRKSMAYVPQEDIVHDTLTVEQELRYAARLRLGATYDEERIHYCVENALTQVQLTDCRSQQIRKLSGGQRRRVNLAVELVSRPRVLFLDEPTSGLDPGTEADLMRVFRRIADQGCTVICTTHIMENIELFDRVAVLNRGRIAYFGPPGELLHGFGIERYTELYARLRAGAGPRGTVVQSELVEPHEEGQESFDLPEGPESEWEPWRQLSILASRYVRELVADKRFIALLVLQPMAVAWLLRAASGKNDDMMLLFLCAVAAFWFGLSNSAREIIGEAPLVRRELMIGTRPASYLGAKLLVLAGCGLVQSVLIVLVVSLLQPSALHIPLAVKPADALMGGEIWPHAVFVLVLFMLAGVGTTIGLTVSAYARSVSWAIAAVPLITIPHLAFSEKVFSVGSEGSLRGALLLLNAIEYGYRWLRGVHDSSATGCWTIGGVTISYPFLALTIMLAGFFLWAWAVLRRRYLSAQ